MKYSHWIRRTALRQVLVLALAGLMIFTLSPSAFADTPTNIAINQATGNFRIDSTCAITNHTISGCASGFQIASGLEFLTVCTASITYASGGSVNGACTIDNGNGKPGTSNVHVNAPACDPLNTTGFRITSDSGTLSTTFLDPALENWTLTSFVIQTTGYTHTGNQDNWALVQYDPVTGLGSYFVATFNGRTLTMALNGAVQSTSNCQYGVPANSFGFQNLAGNGNIT